MSDPLADHDVAHLRAGNPGPFTLTGTNTWIVGRDPCWIVDPGPALDDHLAAIVVEAAGRGGAGGIALTHDHLDHAEAVEPLRALLGGGIAVAAMRYPAEHVLGEGTRIGPLTAVATPGHAEDHVAFLSDTGALFTGDAVLGEGSVFVAPGPGALRGYLAALSALREQSLDVICPGHGPLVTDPHAKLEAYIAHRLAREAALVAALDRGLRGVDALLDDVWSDAPDDLRLAALVTLAAHLEKLDEEGRLPGDVERPDVSFMRGYSV